MYVRYTFKNTAPEIQSGTFVAYEIRPIGVRERHQDVKARMFRGWLGESACKDLAGVQIRN